MRRRIIKCHSSIERYQNAIQKGIIVDQQDKWLLEEYVWNIGAGFHVRAIIQRTRLAYIVLHYCIIGTPISKKDTVYHINGNNLDCRRCNLYIGQKVRRRNNAS